MFRGEEEESKNSSTDTDTENRKSTFDQGSTKKRVSVLFTKIKNFSFLKRKLNKQWFLHTGTGNTFITIVIIILVVLAFSVGTYSTGTNTIQLYYDAQNNRGNKTTLWNTTDTLIINKSSILSSDTFPHYNGTSKTLYLIHTYMYISSHGICNWVENVKLYINQTNVFPVYEWKISYAYDGVLQVHSEIPVLLSSTLSAYTTYYFRLLYVITSSGLMAQNNEHVEYNLILQVSK